MISIQLERLLCIELLGLGEVLKPGDDVVDAVFTVYLIIARAHIDRIVTLLLLTNNCHYKIKDD